MSTDPRRGHEHGDDHGHDHAPAPDDPASWGEAQVLEAAIRELLIEKGLFTAADVSRQIDWMDGRSPDLGARAVARAWTDDAFRQRLLADGTAAVAELGIEIEPTHLLVVENTREVHNVVVCTLCSCYPRSLLGLPPAWYKAAAYRSRVVREPRAVLREFGLELPDGKSVRVHDSTADMRYLVLPERPAGTEDFDEAALAALVSRDAMIGVAVADSP